MDSKYAYEMLMAELFFVFCFTTDLTKDGCLKENWAFVFQSFLNGVMSQFLGRCSISGSFGDLAIPLLLMSFYSVRLRLPPQRVFDSMLTLLTGNGELGFDSRDGA